MIPILYKRKHDCLVFTFKLKSWGMDRKIRQFSWNNSFAKKFYSVELFTIISDWQS